MSFGPDCRHRCEHQKPSFNLYRTYLAAETSRLWLASLPPSYLPTCVLSVSLGVLLVRTLCKGREAGSSWCGGLAPKYREEARQRAKEIEPIIRELEAKGFSCNRIAKELNKRKVPTPRHGQWDHSSVRNVIKRLATQHGEYLSYSQTSAIRLP